MLKIKQGLGILIIILMSLFISGCGKVGEDGKTTGIKYVMAEAGENSDADKGTETEGEVSAAPLDSDQEANGKKVYLTFDDGPESVDTPLILNILDTYGVKATFFVIGTSVEKNPELLKEIYRRGHAVGNHTYNHVYSEIYQSPQAFINSIKKNEALIYGLTGQKPKVIRDPGGIAWKNQAITDLVLKNGYSMVQWNVDSYDSNKAYQEPAQIIKNVQLQAANKKLWPGMIILMHDGKGHLNTVRALPTIIEMLIDQGFEFAVLK